jgi:predicted anti-sigma-YlaC factor YlaD
MATPDRATECDWVRAELAEDLRDPEAARRIDAHMARCPSCRADRDWGLRLASCLSDVPPTPSAIDVAGRVRSLVDRRRWLRRSLATGALASVACLLLGL